MPKTTTKTDQPQELVFDLETNGFPRQGLSRIHCLVIRGTTEDEALRFNDQGAARPITEGINLLEGADLVIGHNIVGFDVPVIQQIYWSDFTPARCIDTLILSRLFFPDIIKLDFQKRFRGMPKQLYGRHSLEAWGYRLHDLKGDFGKSSDWQEWSREMEDYCVQDVHVTHSLYSLFKKKGYLDKYAQAIEIEHRTAQWMAKQEAHGIAFDEKAAVELEGTLRQELADLSAEMTAAFPYVPGRAMTPARNNQTLGYIKGAELVKLTDFNPTSRDHIAWAFQNWRDWEPIEFTETGKPKIDETVLQQYGTQEALTFARLLKLQKMLGQLSEGKNSWLKLVHQGRIHHACMLNTNTGRNAHMRPNLAQVSSDPRCRALFVPSQGKVIVGADASGLELRMLGHYLSFYDDGRFIDIVVNGDIHQTNADGVGVTRTQVQTITYALIYGAGDEKLGKTYDVTLKGKQAKAKGKELRRAFTAAIPGLEPLLRDVAARGDVLRGLDGRPIKLQGKNHAALNYLLQSAGAIVCKHWVYNTYDTLTNIGIPFDPLLFVHDELELETDPEHVEKVERIITEEIILTGQILGVKCPLASEAKHGASWADVH